SPGPRARWRRDGRRSARMLRWRRTRLEGRKTGVDKPTAVPRGTAMRARHAAGDCHYHGAFAAVDRCQPMPSPTRFHAYRRLFSTVALLLLVGAGLATVFGARLVADSN